MKATISVNVFIYVIEPISVDIIAIVIAITVNIAILMICVVRLSVCVSWTAG